MIWSLLFEGHAKMFGIFIISSWDKDIPKRFLIFLQSETRRPKHTVVSQYTKMVGNFRSDTVNYSIGLN